MIHAVCIRSSFPHLDFEMTRAIRYANQAGVRQVEFAHDGQTLFDGEPHPDFRSIASLSGDKTSLIYAILGGAHIKIGWTNNITARIAQIQNGNPHVLTVIAAWTGGTTEEREMHRRLADYRASGEWFADAPAVRKAIKQASGVDVL